MFASHIYSEEGLQTFEDLFLYACPKFISPNGPNFEDPNALTQTIVRINKLLFCSDFVLTCNFIRNLTIITQKFSFPKCVIKFSSQHYGRI